MKIENPDKLFFTSDNHFFHKNIIKFAMRPFKGLEEMHNELINKWNKVVPEDGITFILGDFAFTSSSKKINNILNQLNGDKYLILGNHDEINGFDKKGSKLKFKSIDKFLLIDVIDDEFEDGLQKIFLCHYPILEWPMKNHGSWNLFGHLHTTAHYWENDDYFKRFYLTQYDVGVDANNYTPVSYNEIKTMFTHRHLMRVKSY